MLGERIALLRRTRGLSQAALADRLHISPSAVGMYEQGRREPSVEALLALSRELEVSVDYLLTGRPLCREDEMAVDKVLKTGVLCSRAAGRLPRQELELLLEAMLAEA